MKEIVQRVTRAELQAARYVFPQRSASSESAVYQGGQVSGKHGPGTGNIVYQRAFTLPFERVFAVLGPLHASGYRDREPNDLGGKGRWRPAKALAARHDLGDGLGVHYALCDWSIIGFAIASFL